MTRFEMLADKEKRFEVVRQICDEICDALNGCKGCPFEDRCSRGHNGLMDYLKEEV